jgi:NAD(P)-dependent dehydrogenase (short-subunit alcohol dehydrogenase family)
MRINTRGVYLCCRAALPTMIANRRGSIINVGSRAGSDPKIQGGVAYSASKSAVHMFSFCLAEEVRKHNIAVNALSPGAMRSEGSAAMPFAKSDWHLRVDPSKVAPSAIWLALQDARSFTGKLVQRAEFGETWGT